MPFLGGGPVKCAHAIAIRAVVRNWSSTLGLSSKFSWIHAPKAPSFGVTQHDHNSILRDTLFREEGYVMLPSGSVIEHTFVSGGLIVAFESLDDLEEGLFHPSHTNSSIPPGRLKYQEGIHLGCLLLL